MTAHPTGTVTFLFTDIEGSTKLAQEHPEQWDALRKRHDDLLSAAIETRHGYVFHIIGDAFCAAFPTAGDALQAAIQAQVDLHAEQWGDASVRVRMGLHTGKAEILENGDYNGYATLSRIQRLMSAGHGGQTLLSQAMQDLIRDELPQGITLRDMGDHRLKDLVHPEHIYQVDIPNLPIEFPALKTLDVKLNNLPEQLTSFVGRGKEVEQIKQVINQNRLVTLTGSGGTGKTRLSLRVAEEILDEFKDGVWFIELAPLANPDLIPQTILSVLGTGEQQGKTATQSLLEYIGEKKMLLLLDNCEHLIEACAQLANGLLSHTPALKILASSREALGVKGEMTWRVPSLSSPDPAHLPALEQLNRYEAIRLFTERAMLSQPNFILTNENAASVAQICARLDGIPFAIELAAARVKALRVDQIAQRLDDCFRLLTGGARTALPRQQTLRALIDWSYNLLSEGEKILLRRLAVFIGGWSLEAAEQVCMEERSNLDILDLLTRLVDKSLVIVDESRYHMLETTRQYAREKLFELGEGESLRNQHLDYFAKYAGQNDFSMGDSLDGVFMINNIHAEQDNLRAALQWAFDSRPLATLELAVPLSEFWLQSDLWEECNQWLERSIQVTTGHSSDLRIRAMCNLAMCLLQVAQGDRSREVISCTLVEAQAQANRSLLATALGFHGWVDMETGHLESAQAFFEQALPLARETSNDQIVGVALVSLGSIYAGQGDFVHAEANFLECLDLAINVESNLVDVRAIAFWFLSSFEFARGEIQNAHAHIESALARNRDTTRNPTMTAHYTEMFGRILIAEGHLNPGRQALRKSIAILRDHNSIACLAHGLESFAHLALAENEAGLAAQLLAAAEAHLELLNMSMIPAEKVLYDQALATTRLALPEAAFASAWKRGRAMKADEAVAMVLEEKNA